MDYEAAFRYGFASELEKMGVAKGLLRFSKGREGRRSISADKLLSNDKKDKLYRGGGHISKELEKESSEKVAATAFFDELSKLGAEAVPPPEFVEELLKEALGFGRLGGALRSGMGAIGGGLQRAGGALAGAIGSGVRQAGSTLMGSAKQLGQVAMGAGRAIGGRLQTVGQGLGQAAQRVGGAVKNEVGHFQAALGNRMANPGGGASRFLPPDVAGGLRAGSGGVMDYGVGAFNRAKGALGGRLSGPAAGATASAGASALGGSPAHGASFGGGHGAGHGHDVGGAALHGAVHPVEHVVDPGAVSAQGEIGHALSHKVQDFMHAHHPIAGALLAPAAGAAVGAGAHYGGKLLSAAKPMLGAARRAIPAFMGRLGAPAM
jgi:trimeric autotransporter adhesin